MGKQDRSRRKKSSREKQQEVLALLLTEDEISRVVAAAQLLPPAARGRVVGQLNACLLSARCARSELYGGRWTAQTIKLTELLRRFLETGVLDEC